MAQVEQGAYFFSFFSFLSFFSLGSLPSAAAIFSFSRRLASLRAAFSALSTASPASSRSFSARRSALSPFPCQYAVASALSHQKHDYLTHDNKCAPTHAAVAPPHLLFLRRILEDESGELVAHVHMTDVSTRLALKVNGLLLVDLHLRLRVAARVALHKALDEAL
jgi:hypothetical protein